MSLLAIVDGISGLAVGSGGYTAGAGSLILASVPANMPVTGRVMVTVLASWDTTSDTGAPASTCCAYTYSGLSGSTLTGLAAIGGYTDRNFAAGDICDMRIFAEAITDLNTAVAAAGTVTTVSIVSANGITGTVATATTTPAVTLALGAITPTSVASKGSAVNSHNLNAAAAPTAQTGTVLQLLNADTVSSRLEIDGFAATSYLSLVRSDGTNASPTTLQSADEIGGLNAWGYDGAAIVGPRAALRIYAAQAWTTGAQGTYADVATTPLGATAEIEVMRWQPWGATNFVPVSASASAVNGDAWFDSGQLCRAGYDGMQVYEPRILFIQPAAVTQNTPNAASMISTTGAVGTRSLTAGYLNILGRTLRIRACIYYTTGSTPTAIIYFRLGTNVVATTAAVSLGVTATLNSMVVDLLITTSVIGTSGNLQCFGLATVPSINTFKLQNGTIAGTTSASSPIILDLTQAYALDLDITSTGSGNSFVMTNFTVEALG